MDHGPIHPSWSSQTVSLGGVAVHYTRAGRPDRPSVVLVHGFSDNGLCWSAVARALEDAYDLVLPDMRGHGLSARAGATPEVDMAADVAALIDHLGLDRPVLVGHSMGAMVSYQVAVRFPERIRALVLEDPPWWLADSPHRPPANPAENPFTRWVDSLKTKTRDELVAENRRDHPTWPDDLVLAMAAAKKQLDPNIVAVMAGRMHSPEAPWETTLASLRLPILLFTGSVDRGGIVGPDLVAEVVRLNPAVEVVPVPQAGHLIRFDQPTAFLGALRPFLARHAGD